MSARVLVTGARGGFGRAATAALRARGATVLGLDLEASGEDIIGADVTDQAAVDAAVAEAVERLGGLDVLVNNAGIGDAHDTGAAPDADALRVIDVNLLGAWRVTSAAMPALLRSRGRVVNVASGLAHISVPFAAAYCMSKRGLVGFSDVLRVEYGRRIRVSTIYPGYVETAIHDAPAAKGMSLGDVIPPEPIDGTVDAIVRAALSRRPPRDLATSRRAALAFLVARLAPGLVDRVVARQARGLQPPRVIPTRST